MVLKECILLSDDHNGLRLDPSDCDGFVISELEGGDRSNRVYVYYSEVNKLIECLKKISVEETKHEPSD